MRGADATRRTHAVHGGVACAHDAHAGADRDRPALPHAAQEGHAVDHAAGILARQAESLRQLGAHGHEDGREPGRLQLVEREVDAGPLSVPDLDTETLEDAEVLVDLGLRQPVAGDRPADHATGVRMLLEDRDAHAGVRQPLGGRQAGRPGPTMATRAAEAGGAGRGDASRSWSMMKRLICRIASGWSRCVRMQVFSHRWSQTRPRTAGSGLSRRVMRTASANSPERTAAM